MRAFQLQPVASGSCRHSTTLSSLMSAYLASSSSSRESSATISIVARAINVSGQLLAKQIVRSTIKRYCFVLLRGISGERIAESAVGLR
jgi:hypothetical protein